MKKKKEIEINENLKYFATSDPTKESKQVSIENLCQGIESGKMTLPIFQTYIRWTLDKSVSLLNFQLQGKAPVAPISINKIENSDICGIQVTFIDRKLIEKEDNHSKYSVIDGQQRLSCNYKAYINHEDFKCIVLDLSKGKFIIQDKIKNNQIPVGVLYNKDDDVFTSYLEQHKDLQIFKIQSLLTKIREKFRKYYYTVNYASDLSEEEQSDWFEVLNLAGSRVPKNQVFLNDMLVRGIDFYTEFSNKFFDILSLSDLSDLFVQKTTEISIPLSCLNAAYESLTNQKHSDNFSPIPSDAKGIFMSRLDATLLRNMFNLVLNSLQNSLDFISSNNLSIPNRIDYLTYLTGLFSHLNTTKLTYSQTLNVIDWYNNVDFSSNGNTLRRKKFNSLLRIIGVELK